ncbi:WYL domain-containing protein (plasmid) [Kovacikia minuta CCNUW1]|uniref:helix-turn-helix transcriptional regulator n=1 Tax=Kovacikia minuta TaxID=2931930 RepID=UPI001CCC73A8|nr:WYL domain-containing protein [Kovacikia minuta]UBF30156.1 WYL domain-containing protein [Kovacikia minuta CCNUW1]
MKKTVSKKDNNSNQFGFALEIVKLLAEKPRRREDLATLLSAFLEKNEKSAEDILQKLTRTIAKLRACGFEIRSAPNCPYELVESSFPVILSTEQRQALALAAYFLSDMGFSAQASQIIRIGKLTEGDLPKDVKVNFSPPVDYSEDKLEETVRKLQERFRQQCRYTIRYRSSQGNEQNWDCDRSELRLHNGVLYLVAFIPDFSPRYIEKRPNVEQNLAFRVDRILSVRAASTTSWSLFSFPTLEIYYRMSGALGTYQPRRANERELLRDTQANFVEVATHEDYLFWFRQRILQYGANVRILQPEWFAQQIAQELEQASTSYRAEKPCTEDIH